MQSELNRLEQYLVKNSYKRLQPDVDKLKENKVYYIIRSINLGRRVSVYPIKVTCIKVNTDGTGNFKDAEYGSIYNNISLDNYDSNKQKILGIWYRKPSLSTAFGIGSASKYTAGKKIRKSKRKSKRKSRKSKKSRKTRQAKRR